MQTPGTHRISPFSPQTTDLCVTLLSLLFQTPCSLRSPSLPPTKGSVCSSCPLPMSGALSPLIHSITTQGLSLSPFFIPSPCQELIPSTIWLTFILLPHVRGFMFPMFMFSQTSVSSPLIKFFHPFQGPQVFPCQVSLSSILGALCASYPHIFLFSFRVPTFKNCIGKTGRAKMEVVLCWNMLMAAIKSFIDPLTTTEAVEVTVSANQIPEATSVLPIPSFTKIKRLTDA